MELIKALEEQRAREGLTVKAFTQKLQINRAHYYRILGGAPVGEKVRRAAYEHYPELATLVLESYAVA